ncbi:Vitrin, partial [Cricetulus griseus]
VPQINCDVKAGKIINSEFMVKCPAGCQDPKYHVYGTGVYASYSSVCGAAVHRYYYPSLMSFTHDIITESDISPFTPSLTTEYLLCARPKLSECDNIKGMPFKRTCPHGVRITLEARLVMVELGAQSGLSCSSSIKIPQPIWEQFLAAASVTCPLLNSIELPGEATKAYEKPSITGTTTQPVTLTQALAIPVAEATHRTTSKPLAASVTSSPRPQPVGHRSQEMGFVPKEELSTQSSEPVSQGDPNCKVDLSFLIDGSTNIGKRRFRIQKQFLADVVQALDIGPAGPLVGVVQYGDIPATQFNLKTHVNSQDLKAAIEKITQRGGLSNVGRAISFVTKNFFSKANGNRGGAPNVAVVMVDGWPTDKVEEVSRVARESGINVFFITVEGAAESEKQYVVEPNFSSKAVCRTNGFYSFNVQSWLSLHKTVQPLVKRVCDTDRLACSKTCLNSADIGFVIDGSSSVGTSNFRTVLQFVANLSKEFEISDTDTRIGAVQYTYEQRLEFGFDKYNSKNDILSAIRRVGYWSGGTSTGAAIQYALEQLFKKSKPNKRKVMILITDGRSYDDVRIPAMAAYRKGVITYAIGIAWAAQDELEVIATHPARDHSFFVDEFDNLYKFVPRIIQNICTEFNSQPRN